MAMGQRSWHARQYLANRLFSFAFNLDVPASGQQEPTQGADMAQDGTEPMLKGDGLTASEMVHHMPDHPHVPNIFVRQDDDLAPDHPPALRFHRVLAGRNRRAAALAALRSSQADPPGRMAPRGGGGHQAVILNRSLKTTPSLFHKYPRGVRGEDPPAGRRAKARRASLIPWRVPAFRTDRADRRDRPACRAGRTAVSLPAGRARSAGPRNPRWRSRRSQKA